MPSTRQIFTGTTGRGLLCVCRLFLPTVLHVTFQRCTCLFSHSPQVTKNRFDGDLGRIPLYWDKDTCTMSGHFNSIDSPADEQQSKKLASDNSYSHSHGKTLTKNKLEAYAFSSFGSGKTISKSFNQSQSHMVTGTKKTSSPTLSKPVKTSYVSSSSGSPLATQENNFKGK